MSRIDPDSYADYDPAGDGYRQRRHAARLRRARLVERGDQAALEEVMKHGVPEAAEVAPVFIPTLSASHWERWWISNYLGSFYLEKVITDVLRKVKGGKEATVYCCAAHPATGLELIAAKVYRPRIFRQLRNDARYRQGRTVLDGQGKVVRDERGMRAMHKGTRIGKEMLHASWLAHEYQTLRLLHAAGVEVPRPLAMSENTILMEYVGELESPAPTLSQVRLPKRAAQPLFKRLLANVERMLASGRVHADLSAYNILYWRGEIRFIDFPQAIDPRAHPDAFPIFQRDVTRLCQYFARYGVVSDPVELASEMWARHYSSFSNIPPELFLVADEDTPAD